ncbi:MAG: aminotransferase class I/II-fold pyridoxal phosphate-dependent enzyme [Phycisphaerae bacterium]
MEVNRFFARRCSEVEFSGIRRFFDLAAQNRDAIDLSIGQPDYDAEAQIKHAAAAAIQEGHNQYTPSAGMAALRERLTQSLRREFPDWAPGVLVSSGVSGGLFLSMLATIDPGDEVVFLDPYFVSYRQLVTMIGGTPAPVSSYPDFRFRTDAVERAVTNRTKLLLINSPGNPTGRMMTAAEAQAVAELARKRDLLIVSDEIYNELTFDEPAASPAHYAPERTIVLRGFGKTYGVTGWRLGYVAADPALIEQMTKMQQFTFVCAPAPLQHAMLTALDTDVSHHRRDYARKRDLVAELLTGAFEFIGPDGGFYVFPKIPAGFDSATQFCEAAAEHKVFVIPGNIFSTRDTHFRISFAASDDSLRAGCRALCDLARERARPTGAVSAH